MVFSSCFHIEYELINMSFISIGIYAAYSENLLDQFYKFHFLHKWIGITHYVYMICHI